MTVNATVSPVSLEAAEVGESWGDAGVCTAGPPPPPRVSAAGAAPLPAPTAARPLPTGVAAPGSGSCLGYLWARTFARPHGLSAGSDCSWDSALGSLHGTGLACLELAGLCCGGWESGAGSCLAWETLSPSSPLPRGARSRVEKRGWWCLCPHRAPGDGHGSVEVVALSALKRISVSMHVL